MHTGYTLLARVDESVAPALERSFRRLQLRGQQILADTWSGALPREGTVAPRFAIPHVRSKTDLALMAIAFLICLRFVLAAVLPLSFDEAYYWLWSRHLAPGYLEHPAAIAFAIRAGTLVFGDTQFGVRFVSLVASVCASWAVWRAAAIILSDEFAGAMASLFFNATLMVAAEGMGATPDSLLLAAAAVLLWTIAELEHRQDGRWWLGAGAAAGSAMAAKYTGIFLCASVAVWLLAGALNRRKWQGTIWLRTIWPWAGAAVGLALFVPTLYWNALHGFISFRFQGDRMLVGHPGARYLMEFLGSQAALASPGILVLAGIGARRMIGFRSEGRLLYLVGLVFLLPLIFFLLRALQDRVQGNWPCFVYPALAILAAKGFRDIQETDTASRAARFVRVSALPMAGLILAVSYTQAFFGIIPMGRGDPIARMAGVGFAPVAAKIAAYAAKNRVHTIVTTNYPTTAWLLFYERPRLPVIQISDENRFLSSPRVSSGALNGNILYVTQHPRRELPIIRAYFATAVFSEMIERSRNGQPIDEFALYAVRGPHGVPPGRAP